MEKHPLIMVYGKNTITTTFPLILVIGREPNDDRPMGNHVDFYELWRRVPFWNLPYTLIAQTVGIAGGGRELRHTCERKGSSPIIFADISPRPIRSKRLDKDSIRREYGTADYLEHLSKVADNPLFKRVSLVIFSGLNYPTWAKDKFGDAVKRAKSDWENDRKVAQVRFFYGGNMPTIKPEFQACREATLDIMRQWQEEG